MSIKTVVFSLGVMATPSAAYSQVTVGSSARVETFGAYETPEAEADEKPKEEPQFKISDKLTARAGYRFETVTSNPVGSEPETNLMIHSAPFGLSLRATDHLTASMDGNLSQGQRGHEAEEVIHTGYGAFSIGPGLRLKIPGFLASLRTVYTSVDTRRFLAENEKKPALLASLDLVINNGNEVELKGSLAGKTGINETKTQDAMYGALSFRLDNNFYGDTGVARERDEFFNQNILYGVLGAELRGSSPIRVEGFVGERLGLRLQAGTEITEKLRLLFGAYAQKDRTNQRISDVGVTAGLAFWPGN